MYTLYKRNYVLVNTDPERRCFDGYHFSAEWRWTEWEPHISGLSKDMAVWELDFHQRLTAYAVKARGKGAKCEYKIEDEMSIDNYEDVIDSRDVIERIAELEAMQADEDCGLDTDEESELTFLKAVAAEGSLAADDWVYGVTLVRDSYFTEYTQELVEECYGHDMKLPDFVEVDWKATARNVQQDYTPVEFDGVTYWVR